MTSQTAQLNLTRPHQGEVVQRHRVTNPHETNRELYRVKSSRLVELFPDELIINERTITLVHHHLLFSTSETISIKDIGRVVYIDTAVFDGLRVLGKNTAHELVINGLYRRQAEAAQQIIEGLVLIEQNEPTMPYWLQVDPHGELLLIEAEDGGELSAVGNKFL